MEGYEIDACMNSFEILVDSREQPSHRAEKRYSMFQCPFQRATLNYGDYTYNLTLPSGEKLHDPENSVKGHVVIERKMSLEELSSCFCQGRARFEREFCRASENNARVYLLTENASWEKLITHKYNTKFNPLAYESSLVTWIARYNITPIFCREETSGHLIKSILWREAKHRLESGYYG